MLCGDLVLDTSSPSENTSSLRSSVSSEEEILFNAFEENGAWMKGAGWWKVLYLIEIWDG